AHRSPFLGVGAPLIRRLIGRVDTSFQTELVDVAAGLADVFAHARDVGGPTFGRLPIGHPTIANPGQALERSFIRAAKPDRNRTLDWQGIDAGAIDVVPLPVKLDHRLGPELAQDGDLLFDPSPTIVEILPERLVLDRIPTEADAEAKTTAAQHVDLGRLLGNEGGLSLRKNHDAGHQLDLRGQTGEVSKQRQHLVEQALVGVGHREIAPVRTGAENVVVGKDVGVAHVFDRLGVVADTDRVAAELNLGKNRADLHRFPSWQEVAESRHPDDSTHVATASYPRSDPLVARSYIP